MEIEGLSQYDEMWYINGNHLAPYGNMNGRKVEIFLQGNSKAVSEMVKPMMVKVGYSQKDKEGNEHKIEITVDTREENKNVPPPPENNPSDEKESEKTEK